MRTGILLAAGRMLLVRVFGQLSVVLLLLRKAFYHSDGGLAISEMHKKTM